MKSYPVLLLLPLLLFVRSFELMWVVDRAPAAAPPAEKKTEPQAMHVDLDQSETTGKRKQNMADETLVMIGARLPVNEPASAR